MSEPKGIEDIRQYWNSRAGLGQWAGTRDVIAKQLEIESIAEHIRDGMRILEVGCSNGVTAMEFARRFRVDITAVDYAEAMIAAARELAAGQQFQGTLRFDVAEVMSLAVPASFDLVYTERMLINLSDWESQKSAIIRITGCLAPGGTYVMCENSQDGLDRINELRERAGLPKVTPPWHNRYLRDAELDELKVPGIELAGMRFYSSTYYFLSRVVNAWLAAQEGKEPDYEAPINQLALKLPTFGELGQGRIWLWKRMAA